eukprot:7444381-Pyramimonas_sp.AAC.1
MFHYRKSGELVGKVLVGIQIGSKDPSELDSFYKAAQSLKGSGFEFKEEGDNTAVRLFLC